MAKVKLVSPGQLRAIPGCLPDEQAFGEVQTRLGVCGSFPLHAGFRIMTGGSAIAWQAAASGRVILVWEGVARVGETILGVESAVIIEHGGSVRIDAVEDATALLVFDARKDSPPEDAHGGGVHILPAERVQRTDCLAPDMPLGAAVYADSSCPTCSMWLHENSYQPHFELGLHSHSQDEIIVVVGGDLVIGTKSYGRGSMLAVAKDVLYQFKCGERGLRFVNFRPSRPTYTSGDGSFTADERSIYREVFHEPPPYLQSL
ncbi:MAG TPA: hypothetical protein VFP14_09580 [Novosphingobium sp.]|nr:hypothetical protein [Novosphingobium sp.]